LAYHFNWLLLTGIYSPVFFQLYQSRWETIDYTHAYFILPVSLWAAWKKRPSLVKVFQQTEKSSFNILSLLFLMLGLSMFIFGWRQDYLVITSLSLIVVLRSLIHYLYGKQMVKQLVFPIYYLFFLIPPPLGVLDNITIPMRHGISIATQLILGLLNYPIVRNGLMLTIDNSEIFMGAPCSGFRSLITMFALVVAYLHMTNSNARKKLILLLSVIPFALLGNLVRVISLCLVTYYFGQEAAEGLYHDLSGAIIFLIMIGCVLGLEHLIDKKKHNEKT
jgi:exosortase